MQNIGERLEEARKRKGISIREAAEATKIRGEYLHKFEGNQFDINLPEIYVRGFLRTYAGYLGLPSDKIANDYNALGHGNAKPRTLSRDVYGRMELSVASAKEPAREPESASNKEEDGENPATFKPRPGSLPYLDRALMVKGGMLLSALIAVVVIIWIGVSMWSGSETTPTDADTASVQTPVRNPEIVLHALDTVRVKIVDVTTKQELFQGTITRGDSRTLPKNGSLFLTADPLQNVEVEMDGNRSNPAALTGLNGLQRIRID